MAHIRLGVSQCLQNIGEELIHEQTNIESKPVALVSRVGIEPTTHGLEVRQRPVWSRDNLSCLMTKRIVHFCKKARRAQSSCRLGASNTNRCQTARLQFVSNPVNSAGPTDPWFRIPVPTVRPRPFSPSSPSPRGVRSLLSSGADGGPVHTCAGV